jgi:Zn-dependent protease with chaperone function
MVNLFLRSAIVLALLFGMLFAVGAVVLVAAGAPPIWGVLFALGMVFLQYLLGPWILQLIYHIEWRDPQSVDPALAQFLTATCAAKNIPVPRLGLIHDGNPNAFTFGHYPGDARLVVTTGLLELLDAPERHAVIAHELGHIAHWDFVVMTIAGVVPLVLYMVWRLSASANRGRRKGGSYLAMVGLVSYLAYVVSQYIVLLLSRVREYYADQFSGEVTGDPDSLSTALVKVAYGMAAAPTDKEKKDDTRMVAVRAFGVFDPRAAQALALAGAGSGGVTAETMEGAMKWDLWNPWAIFHELSSTHPLPARRIRALEQQTLALGKTPHFTFRAEQPESYWDEFAVDLLVNYLPLVGLILGAVAGFFSVAVAPMAWPGVLLLFVCAGWWLKRLFSYRHDFSQQRTVRSLVEEVKVSAVRSIPCTVEGTIIGRGIPGLFYSDDLVLQDETGFIVADYRQPLGIFQFLFGWLKAQELVGKHGKAMGWYRRSPRPYLELRKLVLDDGQTVNSYLYPVSQFFVYAGMVLGAVVIVLALI